MPGETRPGQVAAVQAEVQYQPAETIADQYVEVCDGGATGLLACNASRSLGEPIPDIERLLVVVHGALRDSDKYLEHASATALGMKSALIVAPQFLADVDLERSSPVRSGTLYWEVEGWKGGEPALGPAPISSFTAMDRLLQHLIAAGWRREGKKFSVVIIGNSAGGQYVNRYAAVGRGPDVLAKFGIQVRFIISNPSTYLYFTRERPVEVPGGTGINRWRYGFEGAPAYVQGDAPEYLRQYLDRDVTIVLGREDRDHAALLLEVGAAAMAQGANRHQRGLWYGEYISRLARDAGRPPRHRVIELDGVGHAASDVLAAAPTKEIMFG